ncbi:MAG: hypothetical protein C4532_08925 [Candidatus Abyssobacteria bacterium SURF_17]|uniref:Uncharacterized protein n=1 Tax=Candidatus Abyssobacteria bacterium SURF_17 TaxID=2093361 RepID=A0A419EZG9_9BACT|nr:MAG: hypothetical protein C4532_08925 [Candidatus Abyssubacteria bacterium SURF_17]
MDRNMPLQRLLDVQKVDLRIMDLEAQASSIPRRIHEWDSSLNEQMEELAELKKQAEIYKKEQRALERQLDQKQQELAKFNAQLPLIRTNREYKAILLEVDIVEKDISHLEEKILAKMDEVEKVEENARLKEAELRAAQKKISQEKDKLKQRQRELEDSLKGTRSERKLFTADLDSSLLNQYDRIRNRKGGLALAKIQDESCGACHMALPPQVVNEAIGGKIKTCPSCSRLLYWDEHE